MENIKKNLKNVIGNTIWIGGFAFGGVFIVIVVQGALERIW